MVERNDFELIQRYVDGDLAPADVTRAEALLSRDADARAAAASLRALAAMVAGTAEPPDGAVDEIMARIEAMAPPRPGWLSRVRRVVAHGAGASQPGRESRVEDVMSSRSSIVWGISTAAVIVLAGLWIGGVLPPAPEGADATIGAAKRYQAAQMSSKDVALGDTEAQAFMQS